MSNNTKILYVGILDGCLNLVIEILIRSGNYFELLPVENKGGFINALKAYNAQVILIDDALPDLDAFDTFTYFHQNGLSTPVIALNFSKPSINKVIKAMKNGVSDYILKENMYQLPEAITKILNKCVDEQVSEALKLSQANLSAIIENTTDLVYSLDLEYRFITFNKIFKNTIKQVYGLDVYQGRNAIEMLGKFDGDLAEKWKGIYAKAFAGETLQFVNKYPTPDGGAVFLTYSVNPISESGMVIGLSCFSRDITQPKLDEEYLRKSEASLRTITNNTDMGCTLIDNYRRVVSFNMLSAKFCKGYHNSILKEGQFIIDLVSDDRKELIKNILDKVQDGSSINYQISFPISGIVHWFDLTWVGIKNDYDQDFGYLFTTKDITEKKISEMEREKITNDLLYRNKDLEQFTYIISHNLRAPVANIQGLSFLLNDEEIKETEAKALIKGINDSANRLDEVISDLNQILQVDSRLNENIELVNLPLLVNDIKYSVKRLIEKEAVIIHCDFEELDTILTLKSFLYSIFFNLIHNSIKYRKPDVAPKITVISKIDNGHVNIHFKDNGRGIDTTKHGKDIFGLYKRFDTSVDGKGMGLFMVKMQVESLGGAIAVQSNLNNGAEFILRIPIDRLSH